MCIASYIATAPVSGYTKNFAQYDFRDFQNFYILYSLPSPLCSIDHKFALYFVNALLKNIPTALLESIDLLQKYI